MGRLRISFISAMDYTKELINAGEEESTAIHKAALRFNEDESQIKSKLEKEKRKQNPAKRGRKPIQKTKSENESIWICYVGPIYIKGQNSFEIVSAKATKKNNDNKTVIENLISLQKNETVEIKSNDWKFYSKEFNNEQKCDKYISKKTFNNSFLSFVEGLDAPLNAKLPFSPTGYNFTKKYKVNEDCAKMIDNFNTLKEKKFQDYLMLKTFGNDGLSPLRLKDITKQIPTDELMFAEGEIANPEDLSTCLKWRLRGLSIEDAVEKVKVDNIVKDR